MRAWQMSAFGFEGLEFVERTTPQPGPGEVLVEVRAVSFNFRDLMILRGTYNPQMALPRILCSDGAGVVVAVGAGVGTIRVGDRVSGVFMQRWLDGPPTAAKMRGALGSDVDGMLAEYVALPEYGVVTIPDHLSFEEAATLPCAAVAAWNALNAGGLRAGQTVLVQGTGGVSIFALQLARLRGARVIGISSSDEKIERAYGMGLDAGWNYRQHPEWQHWALDQTAGEGVDLVVEVGGKGTLGRSLRSLRVGGTIALVGAVSGPDPEGFALGSALEKQARMVGIHVGSRQDFVELNRALSLAMLRPVGENFHWTQTIEALSRMEEGSHFGKLVVSLP